MKTDLSHLPDRQQQELAHARSLLLNGFEAALKKGAGGTSDHRRNGQVLKIILFGSYARNDWVDEPENGYLSDFDLLIIVSHEKLTDIAEYWWEAEDRILHDPSVGRTVNIIVHTIAEVNQALGRGEYFWSDIARDGVTLYELPGHPLAAIRPMTAQDAYALASRYNSTKRSDLDRWLATADFQLSKAQADAGFRKLSAFSLHQAIETAYACFLLVHTFYFPRSHNIKFLRSLAESHEPTLIEAWPRLDRADRRVFEALKRAYVEARYSEHYDVSPEDLALMAKGAEMLRDRVLSACEKRLAQLKAAAGFS
ncbi:putative nucleotidyltransferase/HEPN domain-containing protein [Brevundimonas bullata]|uniref:Putative nucleotidyltransferase/HEPN domain-containing protein n=1 Tax=Brevundimonas bullata TaxID=13160 RepID=A0A7W7IPR8_9CAUL|nr:HEPN domain-containing protein [Brevundimonas bullata]MBB4798276.1 putative nucleotidyltransferase/HEPN domain-containing protein [Brevundimonas bullata]MBB6383410.1 putative nucleotidyltransferase/HEPN domain-containing protein [Brevundimonas bullata]